MQNEATAHATPGRLRFARRHQASPRKGADRADAIVYQYTRTLPFGDTWEISQPSTLPAYGGRVELVLHPKFRIQGEAMFSKNEHSRNYILNSEPPPGTVPVDSAFKVTYRHLSLRLALDLFTTAPVKLRLSFGPSWLHRTGTGVLLIPAPTTAGFGGEAAALTRLASHLNLSVALSLIALRTGLTPYFSRTPPGSDGNTRHDLHLLVGVNWTLGRPISQGRSHGPSLAPPRTP